MSQALFCSQVFKMLSLLPPEGVLSLAPCPSACIQAPCQSPDLSTMPISKRSLFLVITTVTSFLDVVG